MSVINISTHHFYMLGDVDLSVCWSSDKRRLKYSSMANCKSRSDLSVINLSRCRTTLDSVTVNACYDRLSTSIINSKFDLKSGKTTR